MRQKRGDPGFPWLSSGEYFVFPDPEEAAEGVVTIGGNLSPGMLLSAYSQGIFPWFNSEDPLLWWSPDPRFVVYTEEFHIPSRLSRFIKNAPFTYAVDTAFEEVISSCAAVPRSGQDGTWIQEDMIEAYCRLHREGFAHSVETWMDGKLAGGFYGVSLGQMFFGESMFSRVSEASKAAFCVFAQRFREAGGFMIDSQIYTDHIARFGGKNISRAVYLRQLAGHIHAPLLLNPINR